MNFPVKTDVLDSADIAPEIDVIDPPAPRKRLGALVVPPKTKHSVVPYEKKTQLPAVIATPLGDLDAFIRAANAAPLLTADEEKHYAEALRDKGDLNAAQALVISHLRLVISVARGYLGYGLPHADLIQEGNIGLMKAIKHFDPDRGVRLMTFAVHWIRAEIQDYVVKNWRLVKLATTKNQRKLFFNLRQMKESDKALTYSEAEKIADTLEVKPQEVLDMEERMTGGDTSIDGPVTEDEDNPSFSPIDWLSRDEDGPVHQIESSTREKLSREGLQKALASLDERSRRVIEARWLKTDAEDNAAPATLQELAKELGVSAERVRQIEKKALLTMRSALSAERDDIIDSD